MPPPPSCSQVNSADQNWTGHARPVPWAHRVDRIQPHRSHPQTPRVAHGGCRGYDGVARVWEWCVVFRCFLLPSSPSPSLTLTHVGGLLVDFGLLSLRPVVLPAEYFPDDNTSSIPRLPLSHPAIVKWRAVTVIELPILFVFAYDSLTYGHITGTASPKACATNSTLPPPS